mmetsp:Transcript_19164/g.30018  ORF Transcript_19164/g.30018 Transcript_19164/m.30018 type:complete len:403 (-) Transcript_19164:54-1262(-)|eukprot:CAMPEP_0201506452 /NCGR_PEP_ID=MMETSP0161_2-20130828/358_1 /ASSEMBLY_ACC=CAM_ASM_000251 /TAXON_ID=180227 /ORGANISM="Neoparamoeba aestuarina, Strain SoJaBio B1-5/56/2" /LENGTH=402 /DNA_ID=CAMNT_0047900537 /DNA_START=81 /DNA_END=1289 /DNA_ORIENTATION=-
MNRLEAIVGHLSAPPSSYSSSSLASCAQGDDDVVIVSGWRTGFGKAGRGGFKQTSTVDLLTPLFSKILQETKLPPYMVDDVVIGNVAASDGLNSVRIASLNAGLPAETSAYVLNRACSSGLQAIASLQAAIQSGHVKVGIAGGVESMSTNNRPKPKPQHPSAQSNPQIEGCYWPMGRTSEEVARQYGVDRKTQDYYGLCSQQRAAEAQQKGLFAQEIVQVGSVVADEGIRAKTTAEGLAKLKPAFHQNGCSTAGNSSQVSDGAAAVMLMKRSQARALGLTPQGRMISFATSGCDPRIMGLGPAVAIPKVLQETGLKIEDIDLWEINEAFASQFAYTVESLKIPYEKVNVNGGAIAIGHPLGATGARLTVSILREMERRKAKYGVVSMCIGTGQGAAAIFERE